MCKKKFHSKKNSLRCDHKWFIDFYVECQYFLADFNENFLERFSKNWQIPNVTQIRPVGAELFHAGGQTDGQT